jgi:hypothetical protein
MTVKSALRSVPGVRRVSSTLKRVPGVARVSEWLFGNWQDDYWAARRRLRYYGEVVRLARRWAGDARSVIDVGSGNLPLVLELDWIPSKTSLDFYHRGRLPGCTNLRADFMAYAPPQRLDLVVCLQVLEHLQRPDLFAAKLLQTGRTVIISVPYRWPKGRTASHLHDPIDQEKLLGWTKKPWIDEVVVREDAGDERLIVVLEGNQAPGTM